MKKNYNKKRIKKLNPSLFGLARQLSNLVVTLEYPHTREN
jgi:hypothetical protein